MSLMVIFHHRPLSIPNQLNLRRIKLVEWPAADPSQPQTHQRNSSQQCDAAGPPSPAPKPVSQSRAQASSQIVERDVESGGRGAGASCYGTRLYRGRRLRHENTRRKNRQASDDDRQRFYQREQQSRDHHGTVNDRRVAKAEAIEEPAGLGRDHDSKQIDKKDAAQL